MGIWWNPGIDTWEWRPTKPGWIVAQESGLEWRLAAKKRHNWPPLWEEIGSEKLVFLRYRRAIGLWLWYQPKKIKKLCRPEAFRRRVEKTCFGRPCWRLYVFGLLRHSQIRWFKKHWNLSIFKWHPLFQNCLKIFHCSNGHPTMKSITSSQWKTLLFNLRISFERVWFENTFYLGTCHLILMLSIWWRS